MGDHRGEEGAEGKPERKIANALAWTEAGRLHGAWVVWWWAQNSEPAATLAAGYGLGGAGLYRMKPGSAVRARSSSNTRASGIMAT